MIEAKYPDEGPICDGEEENYQLPENVDRLGQAVIGRRIISAQKAELTNENVYPYKPEAFVITLDNGTQVQLFDTEDCCAFTELESFFLDPSSVDHIIMGVGTTDGYTTWHIYADWGDVLKLNVSWSEGNPFYYGYGFDIRVVPLTKEQ